MMRATTRKKNLKSTSDKVLERVKDRMVLKASRVAALCGEILPVDTGAYADSMHINARGDTASGEVYSKLGRTKGPDKTDDPQAKDAWVESFREATEERLHDEIHELGDSIIEGFTVVNNSSHSYWVEVKVEPVFAQIKGIL